MGNKTTYSFSGYGIASVQLPLSSGPDIQVTYDSAGRVKTFARPAGTSTYTWTTNGNNQVTGVTVTDPNPSVSSRVVVVDPTTGRVTSDTNRGRTFIYTPDSSGRYTNVKAPEGNNTTYTYDSRGNVLSTVTTGKTGGTITTKATYNATCTKINVCANKPDTTTDGLNQTTKYTYDPVSGDVATVTPPSDGSPITYSYQDVAIPNGGTLHLPTGWTSGGTGVSLSYANTINGQPTSSTSGAGATTATVSYTYTNDGDLQSTSGPISGMATSRYYDGNRNVTGVVGAGPNPATGKYPATQTTYDADGRVTKIEQGAASDQGGTAFGALATTAYGFDAVTGRLSSTTVSGTATASTVSYGYDAADRPTTTTLMMQGQGPNRTTTNGYDGNGLLKTVTSAASTSAASTITYGYTVNGKLGSIQDGNLNTTTYAYDGFDRLQTTTYADGSTEVLGHDNNANITSDKRRDGTTIIYSYDTVNRVHTRTAPGISNVYNYNGLGQLTSATGGSFAVSRTWDALGELLTDTIGGNTVTNHYNAAGQRTYINLSGASGYATFQYDYAPTGALAHITDSYNYPYATFTYDDLGRETQVVRYTGRNTAFGYGPDLRLASLSHTLGGGPGNGVSNDVGFGFQYNPAGQIVSRSASNDAYVFHAPVSDTAYAANALNQLTSGSAISYDGQGNNIGSMISPTTQRTFDAAGKITSGYQGGQNTTTLQYDALDRLASVQAAAGATPVRLAWDGDERVGSWMGSSGNNPVMIINDANGLPVVGADFSTGQYTHSSDFFTDERGSLIAEGAHIDGISNAITQHYAYGPYGREASISHASLLGYSGGVALPGAGLVHMRARAYDPAMGRFASPDPIGVAGGINIYGYTNNDPVNNIDPSGTDTYCHLEISYYNPNPGDETFGPQSDLYSVNVTCFDLGTGTSLPTQPSGSSPPPPPPPPCMIAYTPDGDTKGDNPTLGSGGYKTDLPGSTLLDAGAIYTGLRRLAGDTSTQSFPYGPLRPDIISRSYPSGIQLRIGGDLRYRIDIPSGVFGLRKPESIHLKGGKGNMCPTS